MKKGEVNTLEEIFQSNDFRGVLESASEPTRNYVRQKQTESFKPEKARFKLKVWFLDGNERIFFSYDYRKNLNGSYFLDEWTGLKKLIRMIVQRYEGKFKCAMIFATRDPEPDTSKSNYNLQVLKYTQFKQWENSGVGFNTEGRMIYRPES